MADEEHEGPSDSNWLLSPPAPGQIHVHIEMGSEVELSPEARAAIETLVSRIQDDEVSGFMQGCKSLDNCTSFHCTLGKCTPLDRKGPNCEAYVHCAIADFF